jgi:transcriptional regulator with XRE-family HTH domain
MENAIAKDPDIDRLIAGRLKALRTKRGWSLDDLAAKSHVSRATLSRLENAEVSATAAVLGRLCAAHGLTLSRLMLMVEEQFEPLVRRERQFLWTDPANGFERRSISPPARTLAGEALECRLRPSTRIDYDGPPRPALEHHLYLIEGVLQVTVDGVTHDLNAGDCLRYQLHGASAFVTPAHAGAHYVLFIL